MEYLWDYFMRRKGIVLAVFAIFALGGLLGGVLLDRAAANLESSESEIAEISDLPTPPASKINLKFAKRPTTTVANASPVLPTEDSTSRVDIPLTSRPDETELALEERVAILSSWQHLLSTIVLTTFYTFLILILAKHLLKTAHLC